MVRGEPEQGTTLDLQALIADVRDLPSMPTIVMRAIEVAMDPEASVHNLQWLISKDQALSAKILKIVNSAMYSLRAEVSTVSHAVAVLGMETVKSVVMAASVDGMFAMAKDLGTKLMSDHSWGTAIAARGIARRVNYPNVEEALVCGLMHDIGKPVLLENLGARYREIVSQVYAGNGTFYERELQAFRFSHAQVGAMLARKWNFPPQLCEAVGSHHDPLSSPNHKTLACIVNLANLMMVCIGVGFQKKREIALARQPSAEYLKLSGPVLDALIPDIRLAIEATAAGAL